MTEFFVPGVPVPKGSAKAFMRKGMRFPVVIQDNADKQKPWASMIGYAAQQAGAQLIQSDSVDLRLTFYMPRPKSHLRKDGTLRPSAPATHTTKPDLDKLIRCCKDALKGVCYVDDSQVNTVHAHKTYQEQHSENRTGAWIRLQAC